jgi:hypothetical protein
MPLMGKTLGLGRTGCWLSVGKLWVVIDEPVELCLVVHRQIFRAS